MHEWPFSEVRLLKVPIASTV